MVARIVTIAPNAAEIICALGAGDRLVGVSRFCVYPLELRKIPRVGGLLDPNLERIVALRPDLVVLRGRNDSVDRLCRDRSISVYHDQTNRLADVGKTITELGELLDRRQAADDLVKRFQERIAAIRTRNAGRPKPRVFLTLSRNPQALSNILTTGKNTFLDEMIEIAGGVNVFGHIEMMYPQVSPEAILARSPEVILELMPEVQPQDARALLVQIQKQWSSLGALPAVRNGQVHLVTDSNALIPSPRYADFIERVSRLLHPETPVDGKEHVDPQQPVEELWHRLPDGVFTGWKPVPHKKSSRFNRLVVRHTSTEEWVPWASASLPVPSASDTRANEFAHGTQSNPTHQYTRVRALTAEPS